MTPEYVFVYGTLRRGHGANTYMEGRSEYAGPATIKGRLFDMIGYPGLRPGDRDVHGEIYRVIPDKKEELLRILDRYEGYRPENKDQSLFNREVTTLNDEEQTPVWVYYYGREPEGPKVIESGDWNDRD